MGREGLDLQRPLRLGCGGYRGATEGFRVREGQSALLLWAESLDHNSTTPSLMLPPRASPGTKEHPFQAIVGHLPSLGLSPVLYRPRPHPLLPPRRWRSCWHWTRSGRSPSALLLSELLSPLCHRQHPISQHPHWAPPGPRPHAPALPAQGGPACSQPSAFLASYSSLGL